MRGAVELDEDRYAEVKKAGIQRKWGSTKIGHQHGKE